MNVQPDYRATCAVKARELDRAATQLLRRRGYASTGLPRSREFDPEKLAFERRLVIIPMGGKPGWRR